jgi:hypothetical protein
MDKFPLGVMMNKGLTIRTAQRHGQNYVPRLLEPRSEGNSMRRFSRLIEFLSKTARVDTTCSRTKRTVA